MDHREEAGGSVPDHRAAPSGHTLVIPRAHAVTLEDVTPTDWEAVTRLAQQVAQLQRDRLGAAGVTLFLASGKAGEQSVFHLHLHVVPRMDEDGLDLTGWWAPRHRPTSPDALERIARTLREEGLAPSVRPPAAPAASQRAQRDGTPVRRPVRRRVSRPASR